MTSIGSNLKTLRLERGLSQQDVASALNISLRQYQRYESDDASPSLELSEQIADLFEVSLDVLVGREKSNKVTKEDLNIRTIRNKIAHYGSISDEDMKEIMTFIDFIKQRDSLK